jgi:hypothetical protein
VQRNIVSYTLLDLTTSVQDDLQDSSFNSTRIARYLNYGQLAIFNTHMFRFCEKAVTGSLTTGDYTYAQQSDHQSTIGGVVYDPNNTTNRLILDENSYLAHREFFDRVPDPSFNDAGMPYLWTEFGDQIYFDRPVADTYTFRQRYYCFPTQITNDTPPIVPEAFREILELYADFRSEKYRGNHDIAGTYKQEFDDGLENMVLRFAEATQVSPVIMPSNRVRINESF